MPRRRGPNRVPGIPPGGLCLEIAWAGRVRRTHACVLYASGTGQYGVLSSCTYSTKGP